MRVSELIRQAAPEIDWKERADYHEREIQNIKREIRRLTGTQHVFSRYLGSSSTTKKAAKLRQELEKHRVSYGFATAKKLPTKADLDAALAKLQKSKDIYMSNI